MAAAEAAGAKLSQSKIKVTYAADTYNALVEEGVGEGKTVEFALGNIPNRADEELVISETDSYEYLATAYVLFPGKKTDKVTTDLTLTVPTGLNKDVVIEVPAAPAQRNYRTNVLGNLLTNSADFTVVVNPIYSGDYVENVWDGKSISKPEYDELTQTYSVGTPEELAWIANLVNGTLPAEARSEFAQADNLSGETVKLTADINLAGQEWTPIGLNTNRFNGTLDGNGYGIYNLKVTQRHGDNRAALVGNVAGTVAFRNLTIKNASIECPDYTADFYGSAVVGTMYGHVTFENVKVEDSYISGNNKVGALVAHDGVCSSLNIDNCHVSNVTFEALNVADGGSVGGLVGFFQGVAKKDGATAPYGEHKIKNSIVSGCKFNVVNSTNSGKRANAQLIGGISSKAGQELYIENCSVENNTWNEKFYADGVEVAAADRFSSPYGEFIGGERNDAQAGKVFIDGKEYVYMADGAYLVNGEYEISNAAGLKWVADVVNSTTPYAATIFDDKVVKLVNNIDLKNQEWIPIGDDRSQRTEFHGIFDGQGYTISNVKITKKTDRDDENKSSYGLLGNLKGTVKNLTVSNVSISGAPKFIGALVGRMNDGLVENCHVKNSTVECDNWTIGALVGQWNNGKISGCTAENTTVKGYAAVGLVGVALNAGERIIENCSVKNCTFVQNGSFGGNFDKMFGTILGAAYSGELVVNINNCKAETTTINGSVSDALYGYAADGDVIKINGMDVVASGLLKDAEGAYYVNTAEGLSNLNAKMADKSLGRDAVINITADIDFSGKTWTPIDSHADTKFTMKEINGNGHTISNLTINGQAMFTRFAGSGDVTIKNLTFDNAVINSSSLNTSVLTVQSYQNVTLDNVDVKNSTIKGAYKVAPLIATVYNESSSTITATLKNCDVENCTVKATSYDFCTAGMVAFVNAGNNDKIEFENCTVTNVKLIAPNDSYKAHAAVYTTGSGSLFNEAAGVTVTNVTYEELK